jgi:ABC-type multidrug transport system fused ATPase/permease subunit
VAHRLSSLRNFDRILVMENGRVVEAGSFPELIARGGLFATMAARQGLTA